MFKRAQKRESKKQREAELGITEEVKDILGIQDTDSEESSSSSDEGSIDEAILSKKRKIDDLQEDSGSEASEVSEDLEDDGISVAEALENPIFQVAADSNITQCACCPGKVLKNSVMEKTHLESAHHKRRFARFKETVERLSSKFEDIHDDSALTVAKLLDQTSQESKWTTPTTGDGPATLSKRAQKRLKQQSRKEKHERKRRRITEDSEKSTSKAKQATSNPKKKKKEIE